MVKTSQIKKLVNGEIADADDVNQIVENAGTEGGLIPYSPVDQQDDETGQQNVGSTNHPWGDLIVNENSSLKEVTTTSAAILASVLWKNLRKFIYLKDAPSSYSGQGGSGIRVKVDETGLEFFTISNIEIITSTTVWTAPATVTKIFLFQCGGGGGGGAGGGGADGRGGGGGGAESLMMFPYTVIPGNDYDAVIGDGGDGAAAGDTADADDGESTIFDSTITTEGGNGGSSGASGAGGAGASANDGNASSGVGGDVITFAGGNGAAGANGSHSGGGGASRFGKGANQPASAPGNGLTPDGFGGGGSGARNGPSDTRPGGKGAKGVIIILY